MQRKYFLVSRNKILSVESFDPTLFDITILTSVKPFPFFSWSVLVASKLRPLIKYVKGANQLNKV